jgi:U3 small nucleolar RNA-associated protein 14
MSEQADIEAALARATAAYKNVSAERDALKDANDRAEAAEAENEQLRAALGDRLREALGENLFDVLRERDRLREALMDIVNLGARSGLEDARAIAARWLKFMAKEAGQ